ncbi:MAG: NEW3 domain-containing protein [Sphingobacteriia bacterium]|nr:NEW3 domain-containing protein [Sphingobacteriia bacterium]
MTLIKKILLIAFALLIAFLSRAQSSNSNSEASLVLDLKKSKAAYEVAKQKYENDLKLFNEKAVSLNDLNKSKNELLSCEVDYQKLILQLISQQSYITIEKAVKYQSNTGEKRVMVTLRSAMEGNEEYLNQFKEHFDIFTPEMRSGKIYNIYISLVDIDNHTILGSPYEFRIPSITLGSTGVADFELLKDVENLQVSLNYNNRKDEKNIYLKKDASVNSIDIVSMQFSQEANLNSEADYGLSLERFSSFDDAYRLLVIGLPRQITSEFYDESSKVSQIKFAQGINTKKISLKVYLPDRDDKEVVIDKPLQFYVVAVNQAQYEHLESIGIDNISKDKLNELTSGYELLELIPRGTGKIEVRANSLYYEINTEEEVKMTVTVKNAGSRRLDNIKLTTENPIGWKTTITPDLIKSLDPEQEITVQITIAPPKDGGVGAQEVKIKTEAIADNRRVQSEDKTIRIQLNAKTSLFGTIALVLVLAAIIGGIIWFGIKLSRR